MPFWTRLEDIQPLSGGITNVNAVVTDAGRKYVVRLGADIPEHGVMRWNELAIARAAAAAGVSPGVCHAEPGALVFDFLPSTALTRADLHDASTLRAAVALIARVHRQVTPRLRGPVLTFWVFHVLRDYAAFLRDRCSPHSPRLDLLMTQAGILEQAVGKVDLVLGHNDLLPANILRAQDGLWLVDWEYGGFNSPLFDLGGLASNAGLTPEAERAMLEQYFGEVPDHDLIRRYAAMKCASLLREAMWSMVSELTSSLDFDYAAYTAENLDRYQLALGKFHTGMPL